VVETLPAALRSRISMFGAIDHADVPSLLAGADVAVAAATGQESFGYSVVEAMAAGVPVVATDIEGYREVATDGIDALLVPPGDAGSLTIAIGRLLDDDALAARLVQAGRQRADTFDWSIVAARIEDVYRSALARPSLR
jgi:phosphatidylinositol alpha-mannosyltransferase